MTHTRPYWENLGLPSTTCRAKTPTCRQPLQRRFWIAVRRNRRCAATGAHEPLPTEGPPFAHPWHASSACTCNAKCTCKIIVPTGNDLLFSPTGKGFPYTSRVVNDRVSPKPRGQQRDKLHLLHRPTADDMQHHVFVGHRVYAFVTLYLHRWDPSHLTLL